MQMLIIIVSLLACLHTRLTKELTMARNSAFDPQLGKERAIPRDKRQQHERHQQADRSRYIKRTKRNSTYIQQHVCQNGQGDAERAVRVQGERLKRQVEG